MATAGIAGRKASLAVMAASSSATTTVLNEVRSYKFSVTADQIDATSNDSSGWKEVIAGRRSFTLDIASILANTDVEQSTLVKALSSGNKRFFVLTPATAITQKYKFWGNIKSFDVDIKENDVQLRNFSVEGTRALVYTS